MGIRNFNLRSEFTEQVKIGLNHPLVYINFFSPTLTQFFICPSSTQYPTETLRRWKNYWTGGRGGNCFLASCILPRI
jgi:hypothetical protein